MKRLLIFSCILICSKAFTIDFIMPDQYHAAVGQSHWQKTNNIRTTYSANPINNGRLSVNTDDIVANGICQFALKLDNAMSSPNMYSAQGTTTENIVFSPVSLAGNLALLLLAAKGQTFQEISRLLSLVRNTYEYSGQYYDQVHSSFGHLLEKIAKNDGNLQINYANGIFVKSNQEVIPNFVKQSYRTYKADTKKLNFSDPKHAATILNNWVKSRTGGKISEIIRGDINPFTIVVIASTLFFSAEWNTQFLEFATRRDTFNIEPNQPISLDFMFTLNEFPYYESQEFGATILGLPYKDANATMYILLPKAEGARALKQFKKTLNPSILENLVGRTRNERLLVGLPKMKLTSALRMKDTLKSLGLSTLFTQADLSSGFLPSEESRTFGIKVEEVLHNVDIIVNEKGTVATAATVSFTVTKSGAKNVNVDRPFIFFIRHDITKLMLFWGSINKPTPSY